MIYQSDYLKILHTLYLICRIYVFVILKIKILYNWAKVLRLFISYKLFFLIFSTCLCLYTKNIYKKNNIIMNTYILEDILLKTSSNSFKYWLFIDFQRISLSTNVLIIVKYIELNKIRKIWIKIVSSYLAFVFLFNNYLLSR